MPLLLVIHSILTVLNVMNVYVAEREGVNYTMYVRTQVYVQFVHLYSQKTSLKKRGAFDRGAIVTGGYCNGGKLARGQLARGLMSGRACVHGGHLSGGNCPVGNWPDTFWGYDPDTFHN